MLRQVWGIGLVRLLDVLFEPVFEELHHLDGHGCPPGIELGLKRQNLFGQLIVLGFVFGEIRIVMRQHEAFFVGEVRLSVLDQPFQDLRHHSLSLTGPHGRLQFAACGKQHLMLGVDGFDTNRVVVFPFKHGGLIDAPIVIFKHLFSE
jgi:hypothetical protein